MNLEYKQAPMHYINNEPAYKHGEWAGLKSCKFGPTRRIIRPVQQKFIFTAEGTANIMPRKKHFDFEPTKEIVFRSSSKQVDNQYIRKEKVDSLKPVKQVITYGKERPERKHLFDYIEKRKVELNQFEKDKTSTQAVKEEFRLLTRIGFTKDKNYKKLLGVGNSYMKEVPPDQLDPPITNLKKDVNYVKTLTDWDKNTLPKINK